MITVKKNQGHRHLPMALVRSLSKFTTDLKIQQKGGYGGSIRQNCDDES